MHPNSEMITRFKPVVLKLSSVTHKCWVKKFQELLRKISKNLYFFLPKKVAWCVERQKSLSTTDLNKSLKVNNPTLIKNVRIYLTTSIFELPNTCKQHFMSTYNDLQLLICLINIAVSGGLENG